MSNVVLSRKRDYPLESSAIPLGTNSGGKETKNVVSIKDWGFVIEKCLEQLEYSVVIVSI